MRKIYALFSGLLLTLATITSNALPVTPDVPNFTFTVDAATRTVVFTNTSVLGSEPGARMAFWSFGDGSGVWTGPLQGTTHTYAAPGTFNVCLKIVRLRTNSGDPASSVIICKTLIIHSICTADFEKLPPTTASNPLLVTFRALPWSNSGSRPIKICWEFGDGTPNVCINYPNSAAGPYTVTHQYQHPGLYEVCVKITYANGCEARKCKNIRVEHPDQCSADFVQINTTSNPLRAHFNAIPQHNNNRKPARVCWNFGDGTPEVCTDYPETYTGAYGIEHTYAQAGQYNVCVKILYYGGCEARKCKVISVPPVNHQCSVRLLEIIPAVNSRERAFIAIPDAPPPLVERICWYFGDGDDSCVMMNSTVQPPYFTMRHIYPGPGVYRACVKIKYRNGCIAESCREVVIRGGSHVCGGYMTDSMTGPRTYKFKAFGILPPNDHVVSYAWNFGDGTAAVGQEVTHTFANAGTYNVCVLMRSDRGCETRICKSMVVPGNTTTQLHLSPNPVIHILNVDFFSFYTQAVNIQIRNSNGTVVRNYSRNVNAGQNNWTHDLSNLLPGIYTYSVQSPNQLASAIFLKQ
jgi:PKD repeat protein